MSSNSCDCSYGMIIIILLILIFYMIYLTIVVLWNTWHILMANCGVIRRPSSQGSKHNCWEKFFWETFEQTLVQDKVAE